MRLENWPPWSPSGIPLLVNPGLFLHDKLKPVLARPINLLEDLKRGSQSSLNLVCDPDLLPKDEPFLLVVHFKSVDVAICRSLLLCVSSHVFPDDPASLPGGILHDLLGLVVLEDPGLGTP